MDELEKVRGQALGKKADPAYLEKFPIKGCEELMIPTRGGNALVHLYRPQALTSPLPAVINFHGGGFVKGYRGRDIEFSQMIASRGTYLVFDVDYKVAPEYPYPCALEEGEDVVTYLLAHMADYDGDRNRTALMGESSGGNLAIGISLKLKKIMAPQPSCVICCYPPCDLVTDPAVKAGGKKDDPMSERGRLYNSWYLPDGRNHEIYASPLLASPDDLVKLPPFTVITAEEDILCREALEFAEHLIEAGVTVTVKKVLGAKHAFLVSRATGYERAEQVVFQTFQSFLG